MTYNFLPPHSFTQACVWTNLWCLFQGNSKKRTYWRDTRTKQPTEVFGMDGWCRPQPKPILWTFFFQWFLVECAHVRLGCGSAMKLLWNSHDSAMNLRWFWFFYFFFTRNKRKCHHASAHGSFMAFSWQFRPNWFSWHFLLIFSWLCLPTCRRSYGSRSKSRLSPKVPSMLLFFWRYDLQWWFQVDQIFSTF